MRRRCRTASAATTNSAARTGIVCDRPVEASDGPPELVPGVPGVPDEVVDVAGVYVADSASTATWTVPPSTLTTLPAIVAAPGIAVVTVDRAVGRAIDGRVIVKPVIDAVLLRVEPVVEVLVCPVPMLTDGGVNATFATLSRTSLNVLVTEPSAVVSCAGTASLPRIFRVPTLASATGVGELCDAIALVCTVMLPSAASGSVSPVTAAATPLTSACSALISALRLLTSVWASACAAAAAVCAVWALTALPARVARSAEVSASTAV